MVDWSSLRAELFHVPERITYSWSELEAMAGSLPRSAYEHAAYWKGKRSGWPGFTTMDVRVGKSVTFIRQRVDADRATSARATPDRVVTKRGRADVVLIGCVKKKRNGPAPAKDLYVSDLFRKERAYAEGTGSPWFILSAEHGLVAPESVLAPYDVRLSDTSADYRRRWGNSVVRDLVATAGRLDGKVVELHAGSAYTDAIRQGLRSEGAQVVEPLAGLGMGQRLAWYARSLDTELSQAASSPPPPGEIAALIELLLKRESALSPAEFLATRGDDLKKPGLYSWWVDSEGARDLGVGLGAELREGLIYAGLAGATRSKSGRKSTNTLWGRIRGMHLGGRHEFSTFRLSLGSVLAQAEGLPAIHEDSLTTWMHKHLRVIAVPVTDADTLGDVETEVLAELDPPLNLDKRPKSPVRSRLSELRKQYGRKGGQADGSMAPRRSRSQA